MEYAGGGGMGAVYRTMDTEQQLIVAVKILKPDIVARNQEYVRLFEKEVKATQRLDHPNIVKVLDRGIDDGISYMVMEWLDGEGLEDVITQTALPLDRVVRIFEQVCDAIACAHENDVSHLDIKPSNIMLVNTDRSEDVIKVIDFGLARIIERESGTTVTKFRGTEKYCAPEQFGGRVSYRSDIYSLGATLYYLLTGVLPFGASYVNAKMHPNLELPMIPSVARQRGLPFGIDIVLRKALHKNPTLRQQSARQLFEEFNQAVSGKDEQKRRRSVLTARRDSSATAQASSASAAGPLVRARRPRHLLVLPNHVEGVGFDDWTTDGDAIPPQAEKERHGDRYYLGSRFAGACVDLLVVAFISAPFAAVIELTIGNWGDPRVLGSMGGIVLVVMFLYLAAATALAGRTWGMSLFSLYTADVTGRPPTAGQCVMRTLLYMLSLATLGLGLLYAFFDVEGRTAHDILSRTIVLKDYEQLRG